jgi:peptidoglycan L-alanyl-D-glutamate endopeptidase CwlK
MDKISIERLEELHPKFKGLFKEFYSRVVAEVPLENGFWRVVQGFRSFEYQEGLYAQGRSVKGAVVTNCRGGQSPHNYGVAVDVIGIVGKQLVPVTADIVKIAKEMGLVWGGDFKSYHDTPHFEIAGFKWQKFLALPKDKEGWVIV